MADAWLKAAGRMPAQQDGGFLRGGAPRAVWFTSETDPRVVSARSVAQDLLRQGTPAHLVWNPLTGDLFQLLPLTRAGRLLDTEVGCQGRVCLQTMVVGFARDPFTSTPMKALPALMAWLDAWQVARRWPAGPPLPTPQAYQAPQNPRLWARGGHFGCSQVPGGALRADPGAVDIRKITGPDTPVAPIPRPLIVRPRDPDRRPAAPRPVPSTPRPTSHDPVAPMDAPSRPIPVPARSRP